jgi:hypothetical protein
LELAQTKPTVTYGHRQRWPDECAEHMGANVIMRVVGVPSSAFPVRRETDEVGLVVEVGQKRRLSLIAPRDDVIKQLRGEDSRPTCHAFSARGMHAALDRASTAAPGIATPHPPGDNFTLNDVVTCGPMEG